MYRQITSGNIVLSYSKDYFNLSKSYTYLNQLRYSKQFKQSDLHNIISVLMQYKKTV
jgi:hypothetical protein